MEFSLHRPEVHEQLPDGLIVEKRLSSNGAFGDVYVVRDERRPECGVTYLRARITPQASGTTWEKPFQERLQKMYGRYWPHVSPLSDVRRFDDGRWLLCHPAPPKTLAAELQEEKGGDRVRALRLGEQLLAGLAELHGRGISYGGLCPKNVWIEPQGNSNEAFTVALGDVEIGDLATWSENTHLENYDSRYHSVDRKGIDGDLYAAGIILVELLQGRQAVTTALAKRKEQDEEISALANFLPPMFGLSGKAARLAELARSLLSSHEDRPQDAHKALAFLRQSSLRRMIMTVAATAAGVVALFLLAWLWIAARSDARNLAAKIGDQDRRIRDAENERDDWRRKSEEWERRATEPPKPTLPPSTSPSQKQWNDIVSQVGATGSNVDQILEKAKALIEGGKAHSELPGWYKTLAAKNQEFAGWERSDPQQKLPGLLRSVAASPWDKSAVGSFDGRMMTLKSAAQSWRSWVDDLARKSVDAPAKALPDDQREVVERWIGQFNQQTQWTLRVKHLKADPNKVTIKSPCRITIGKDSVQQEFTLANPYDQNFDDVEGKHVNFAWQPNDPLSVQLEDDGWFYNNVAYGEFQGPFALQLLHWKGEIVGLEYNATLKFEILDCPGPPRLP